MAEAAVSVIKVRDILMVGVPADAGDETIAALQGKVLSALERYEARGVVLDISGVEVVDSFFARTIVETAQMVALMGGRTVIVGMRPSVAITTTQLGLTLGGTLTALDLDRALGALDRADPRRPRR